MKTWNCDPARAEKSTRVKLIYQIQTETQITSVDSTLEFKKTLQQSQTKPLILMILLRSEVRIEHARNSNGEKREREVRHARESSRLVVCLTLLPTFAETPKVESQDGNLVFLLKLINLT